VVNDGSTDGTEAALARLRVQFPSLVTLAHTVNRGYGAAEKTLLTYAWEQGADVGIVLHSDGQYSPELIPDLLRPFDDDTADMVQGSRMLGGSALKGRMPLYKFVANKVLTAIENRSFGLNLAEYHSGYMLYSRKTIASIPFEKLSDSFDFDLEMIVMAHIKGLRIQEIAIPTIYAGEVSHLRPVQYGLRVLGIVANYKRGKYDKLTG
jgi:glycosyltransferase involved in cell wall biosynthesis